MRIGRKTLLAVVGCAWASSLLADLPPFVETRPHELDVLIAAGHNQGADCSEAGIYLGHQHGVEMVDWNGRHLRHVDVPAHMGDVACADGKVTVNGKSLGLDDLKDRLARVAKFYPDQAVIIRADKDVRYELLVGVIDTCRAANVWNFSFATNGEAASSPLQKK